MAWYSVKKSTETTLPYHTTPPQLLHFTQISAVLLSFRIPGNAVHCVKEKEFGR